MSLNNLSATNASGALFDAGDFVQNKRVVSNNQILYYTDLVSGVKCGFVWKGTLPHIISTNDPNTDGGISDTAWMPIIYSGLKEKLGSEGITLNWSAHLPTVEVAYGLQKNSLKLWKVGQLASSSDYWLYSDGTVWNGTGTLGNTPQSSSGFEQITPNFNASIKTYAITATDGQTTFNIPFTFSTINVFVNGSLQLPGINYTINGSSIVFSTELELGDDVYVFLGNPNISTNDKLNRIYTSVAMQGQTTLQVPYDFGTAIVYINGVLQNPSSAYSIGADRIITFSEELYQDDEIIVMLGDIIIQSDDYVLKNDLSGINGATQVGTMGSSNVQTELNDLKYFNTKLSESDGFNYIGQVDSYANLKLLTPSSEGQTVKLKSYNSGWNTMVHSPLGGGFFISRLGNKTDDGGYICVPTGQSTYYWQRIPNNPGNVCATEFGLYDGANLDTIISNAIKYCISNSKNKLSIPSLGPLGYTLEGGLEFINSTNGLIIEGPGLGTKGTTPVITHTGSNIGITFKRNSQAQSLFNNVILKNFTIVGNSSATAFVRFSDFYGGAVYDSLIRDYTNGTAIDVYNDKGWTEVLLINNVIIRTTQKGIWFHSNPESTDFQTLSFYGANINNFGFQHGIPNLSYGIYVGDGTRADNLYNCVIDMMGWWEVGGNSTAVYISNNAIIDGTARFRYDGYAANALTSTTQPCRLVRKAGSAGWVKLDCTNYKHLAGLGTGSGVTSLSVRPFLALADITSGNSTRHPVLPGEGIVSVPGMKCKLTGQLIKNQNTTVKIVGLLPWHRYKVTVRSDISSTAQQQYIVNIPTNSNAGITYRTDSVSNVSTNTTLSTVNNVTTANSTSTASNKNYNAIYISNANSLPDNTYSDVYFQSFELHLDGTSGSVINDTYEVSIEIEIID